MNLVYMEFFLTTSKGVFTWTPSAFKMLLSSVGFRDRYRISPVSGVSKWGIPNSKDSIMYGRHESPPDGAPIFPYIHSNHQRKTVITQRWYPYMCIVRSPGKVRFPLPIHDESRVGTSLIKSFSNPSHLQCMNSLDTTHPHAVVDTYTHERYFMKTTKSSIPNDSVVISGIRMYIACLSFVVTYGPSLYNYGGSNDANHSRTP